MKNMGTMLLQKKAFSEIVIGNTALVRAMVECSVDVVSSYPGSPTPEIATAISSMKKEVRPFYFEFSTNEKVASELAFGASINGNLSCVFFKSVGLNVAADTIVQLSLMQLVGGMVIVLGDDPGANSSQNEQDNRHFAEMAYIPVLEPANPQEAYSMFKTAANVSRKYQMPVIVRMTTHVCHAKMKVDFSSYSQENTKQRNIFSPKNGPYIPITKTVFPLKRKALEKLSKIKQDEDIKALVIRNNTKSELGIITGGLPYLSLRELLPEMKEAPSVLKLPMVYPLDEKLVLDFLKKHAHVIVLEELDNFLELKIKALAYDHSLSTKITGKMDPEDWIGEYTADKLRNVLAPLYPEVVAENSGSDQQGREISPRPAQMCPGCGHRSAYHAIQQALDPEDITVADIGCHTLGAFSPYEIGQALLCMGHSCGTAAGLSLGNEDKAVIAFLGDSTFFHAGLPGIVNAVFNQHNFILIVMENGTTAMTGHQNHPATGRNFNELTEKIPLRQVLEGLGVQSIREVDTYSQEKLKTAVLDAKKETGFRVIIAKHPCMLKLTREASKKPGYVRRHVDIDQSICSQHLVCIETFACPTFQRDAQGKIHTQKDLCIGDGSCIQTCPVKAIKLGKKE